MRYENLQTATLLLAMLPAVLATSTTAAAEDAANAGRRLERIVQWLASDDRAGREVGTPEIDQAAEFLRQQFADLGLATDRVNGSAFQSFRHTLTTSLGQDNVAALAHPKSGERIALALDESYRPLALGGTGPLDMPLVFVGYGITAPEANYDDYAGIDVVGKGVIVLRHEPQQADPDSPFNGTHHSVHAPFRRKVQRAIEQGAAAILFCTDQYEIDQQQTEWDRRKKVVADKLASAKGKLKSVADTDSQQAAERKAQVERLTNRLADYDRRQIVAHDPLLEFSGAGHANDGDRLPILCCNRASLDALFSRADKPSLAEIEQQIDQQAKPASFDLEGWRLQGRVDIERKQVALKNVIALLDGRGPTAGETLVIGAHYDHIGLGKQGSSKPGSGQIHNGADDNASGIGVLLEIARHFASQPQKPTRRLVFIAFTGEEQGLLGSTHYVKHPVFPLESTIAMINFDMVGRLANNELTLSGVETASEFSRWIDQVNERHGFDLTKIPGGLGPSDHASFCRQQIPVLHFFTGFHDEYHRPSDDVELLNIAGMCRVSDFATELVELLLARPERPRFTESTGKSRP